VKAVPSAAAALAVAAPMALAGLPGPPVLTLGISGEGSLRAGRSFTYLVSVTDTARAPAWLVHLAVTAPPGTTVIAADAEHEADPEHETGSGARTTSARADTARARRAAGHEHALASAVPGFSGIPAFPGERRLAALPRSSPSGGGTVPDAAASPVPVTVRDLLPPRRLAADRPAAAPARSRFSERAAHRPDHRPVRGRRRHPLRPRPLARAGRPSAGETAAAFPRKRFVKAFTSHSAGTPDDRCHIPGTSADLGCEFEFGTSRRPRCS
jgi:hypothetical protein